MDRKDRHGAFEQEMGTRRSEGQSEANFYRQGREEFGTPAYRGEDESSRQWGFVAAGALMLGLGTYLLYHGAKGASVEELPAMRQARERFGQGSMHGRERSMGGFPKGKRETPGVQVREQVTVNRSLPDLYRFWRNVENLPRVMTYLEDVSRSGDRRSHWVARGPAGQRVEWDAEVTDARENELVAWRSLEGSEVPNEGSVRFSRSPDGSGTVIDVALTYHPPGGKAGAAVAKLFGREPAQEIRRDLERFKERVESGNLILATGSQGSSIGG